MEEGKKQGMDENELVKVFVDVQKEYTRENKAKDRVIFILLLVIALFLVKDCISTYMYETVESEQKTQEVEVATEGENASIDYSNIEGDQYKDNSVHNETNKAGE